MSKFQFKKVTPPGAAAPAIDVQATAVAQTPAQPVANAATPAQPVVSAATPVQPAVNPQALAPVRPAAGAVVEYRGPATYGDDSDRVGVKDINMPRLNIVQKVGELSNIFTPGDIVLNKESVIYKSPKTDPVSKEIIPQSPPLEIVILGFRPDRWVEKTVGGQMGDIVDSPEQVVAAGGTIDFNESEQTGKTLYQQLAEALVLVRQPEGVTDPAFSYVADGKRWALCLWAQKGAAYTNGAKIFRTARKSGFLKDEVNLTTGAVTKGAYYFGSWVMTTFLKPYSTGNFAWIPVPKRGTETGPEVRALAQKIVS